MTPIYWVSGPFTQLIKSQFGIHTAHYLFRILIQSWYYDAHENLFMWHQVKVFKSLQWKNIYKHHMFNPNKIHWTFIDISFMCKGLSWLSYGTNISSFMINKYIELASYISWFLTNRYISSSSKTKNKARIYCILDTKVSHALLCPRNLLEH